MSIPLDRLYHYIDNIVKEITDNVVIYRVYPHGSKNLEDFTQLDSIDWLETFTSIPLICTDQEPLTYEYYQNIQRPSVGIGKIIKSLPGSPRYNFRQLGRNHPANSYSILHSEQRSLNLKKYQDDHYITAYYWSHAIISLEWYRYAQHVTQKKNVTKRFLIYNRAWSGTREYRLKFSELLIKESLENNCKMNINPIEPELGIHYKLHKFSNPLWCPTVVLENYFSTNNAQSHYSADFDIEDYNSTDIEVVLETLFDDGRLHLTEKSLRPIACGQPFILAATHGSLEYLRSYGFKTFGDIWDESYDLIEDPQKRLHAIIDLMKKINSWDTTTREKKLAQAHDITEYNKNYFFSKEFFNLITAELKNNLQLAIEQINMKSAMLSVIDWWSFLLSHKQIEDFFMADENKHTHPSIDQLKEHLQNLKNQYLL